MDFACVARSGSSRRAQVVQSVAQLLQLAASRHMYLRSYQQVHGELQLRTIVW